MNYLKKFYKTLAIQEGKNFERQSLLELFLVVLTNVVTTYCN